MAIGPPTHMESETMRYLIDNQGSNDPSVNLALEEYCLTNLESEN